MLLFFDEQLFQRTNGQTGKVLEKTLLEMKEQSLPQQLLYGETLTSTQFLVEQEQAEYFCFQLVKKYWGEANLFVNDSCHEAAFTIETANEKIQQFFDNPQNEQKLFNFIHVHGEVELQQLMDLIVSKPLNSSVLPNELDSISVYKVGDQYLIQPIYSKQATFWQHIYMKKIYSLFVQVSLDKIERPVELMNILKTHLQQHQSINRAATVLHKLVQQMDFANPKSYALKQLHLLNVCTHFTSGRRHMLKLKKCIQALKDSWSKGPYALNDKENTLLAYILFQEAAYKKNHQSIMKQGLYLIEGERLNNHAIELIVEYEDVLSNMNPRPNALVKDYKANYLEHVFYVLIDALVKDEQFEQASALIKNYELASCTVLFELVHTPSIRQELHKIEAMVQQNIAVLVDGSIHRIRESLPIWQQYYLDKKGPYYAIAEMTSQHICNLLKILFYEEQDPIVEKLLSVYKKYLLLPAHLHNFRQFIEQHMTVKA